MARTIQKGSAEHNAHLETLKALAKSKDKAVADAAAENLKQHETAKPVEQTEPKK